MTPARLGSFYFLSAEAAMDRCVGVPVLAGLLICAVILFFPGCSQSSPRESELLQQSRRTVALTNLRQSLNPQLSAELQRIEAQKQLPEQLDAAVTAGSYDAFAEAYPSFTRAALQREINALWPEVALRLEPGAWQRVRELVAQQAPARQRFARAIQTTRPQPQLRFVDTLAADDEWLDAIRTGCRVEGFAAADALAEQQPAAAIAPLERMFFVSRQLARENQLTVRLTAAEVRADACQVLHAIANHPLTTPEILQQLQSLLVQQCSNWPTDESVWIAERAQGLIALELVRSGQFPEILPAGEREELKNKGLLSSAARTAIANVEQDTVFYLQAIQHQITAAKQPYWQRAAVHAQLQAELQTRTESGEFPLVAGSLLLRDVAAVHHALATDRTRCEAWLLALTTICELPVGTPPPCPLTGQSYELQVDREGVRIEGLPLRSGEMVVVTRPGLIQARRAASGFETAAEPLRLR